MAPVFLPDEPHSEENESVEGELRARLYFTHPLFRNDSVKVFRELLKVLVGSKYAATIARFRDVNGRMDGRGAYFYSETQNAGQAVWEEQIKTSDDYMKTRKWNGLMSLLLKYHIDGHLNAL